MKLRKVMLKDARADEYYILCVNCNAILTDVNSAEFLVDKANDLGWIVDINDSDYTYCPNCAKRFNND